MKTLKSFGRFWTVGIFALVACFACMFLLAACGGNQQTGPKENALTISVANKEYDGEAIQVNVTSTSGKTPTILYRLQKADVSETTDIAPRAVGEYVVDVSIPADEEYLAAHKTANFSITQKVLTPNWTAPENLVYSKTEKVATATLNTAEIVEGDVCNFQVSLNDGDDNINVGFFTYTASLSGADAHNYVLAEENVSREYEITQKEVGLNWTAPSNLVYSGTEKEASVAITGVIEGDTCNVEASLTAGTNNIDAGTFTYTATGLTNDNYKLPENAVSDEYTITPIIVENLQYEFVYDGLPSRTPNIESIPGLKININFENQNVGASVANYEFLLGDSLEYTENYDVDNNFSATIVKKEVTLTWQDNTEPFVYVFKYAHEPEVQVVGLVPGDICEVVMAADADNVSAGSIFTFTATGLTGVSGTDATNYILANNPSNLTSPEYYIEYGDLFDVGDDLGLLPIWEETSGTDYHNFYFRVNLTAGKTYAFNYNLAADDGFTYVIYKDNAGSWEEAGISGTLDPANTTETFNIAATGEYCFKLTRQTHARSAITDTISIVEQV